MCLGIPMRVVEVNGYCAQCEAKGVARTVSLLLLDRSVAPGDHVLVHMGNAVQTMTADEARSTWDLLDQILAPAEVAGDA